MTMRIKFSPEIPFFLALMVELEKIGRQIDMPERDINQREQGLGIELVEANRHETFVYSAWITFGDFGEPMRAVLLEVMPHDGDTDEEATAIFRLQYLNHEREEMFDEHLRYKTSGNNPAGAGVVVAQFIMKYLWENVIPDTDGELPEQLQKL